jgi:hypothetical protein
MPHLILTGCSEIPDARDAFPRQAHRWRRAVMKTEGVWMRTDRDALLVEGVVIEFSRALHPLAIVAGHHDDVTIRLWDHQTIERTDGVQRWLAIVARTVLDACGGRLKSTNITVDLWQDLELPR